MGPKSTPLKMFVELITFGNSNTAKVCSPIVVLLEQNKFMGFSMTPECASINIETMKINKNFSRLIVC